MKRLTKPLLLLFSAALCLTAWPACSSNGVERRQEAIGGIHDTVIDRRATRIQARDERMSNSRNVWFQ